MQGNNQIVTDPSNIKVAVLGNSNCIGNGAFTPYLAALQNIKIENYAIGGSSATCGLYMANLIDLSEFDFCIIDFTINDQNMLLNRGFSPDQIRTTLISLIYKIRSHGCIPILLHFPVESSLDGPTMASIIHKEICVSEDVFYIDYGHLIRKVIQECGVPVRHVLRDPVHLTIPLAKLLSTLIAEALRELRIAPMTQRPHKAMVFQTRSVDADRLQTKFPKVIRTSRLRSATHLLLRQGDILAVSATEQEKIMGILVNMGGIGANVLLSGGNKKINKNLNVRLRKERISQYVSLLADVLAPIQGGRDGVSLSISSIDVDVDEKTPNCYPPEIDAYGELELEGVIFRDLDLKPIQHLVPSVASIKTDLSLLWSKDFISKEILKATYQVASEING